MQIGGKDTASAIVLPKLIWKPKRSDLFASAICTKESISMTQFNSAIVNAASQTKMLVASPTPNYKPWYDKECCQKWKLVRDALKESRSPSHLARQYHIHKSQYKTLIREKKDAHFSDMREKVNSTTNPSQFWSAIRSLRRRQMNSNPIPEGEWMTFYSSIQPVTSNKFIRPHGPHDEEVDGTITLEELEVALKRAKNKKSPGPDGISAEFYKHLPMESKLHLLKIMNDVLISEEIPLEWGASTTVMLH
jgi:hypothetical protein